MKLACWFFGHLWSLDNLDVTWAHCERCGAFDNDPRPGGAGEQGDVDTSLWAQ